MPRVMMLFNKPRADRIAAAADGRCPDELLYGMGALQRRGWEVESTDEGFISSITFDPTDASILYATTGIGDFCGGGNPADPNPVGFGLWQSEESGDSWAAINNGLEYHASPVAPLPLDTEQSVKLDVTSVQCNDDLAVCVMPDSPGENLVTDAKR